MVLDLTQKKGEGGHLGVEIQLFATRHVKMSFGTDAMPQPKNTLAMVTLPAVGKQGRGRPPKPDALTPADRAKRYREKVKAKKSSREATAGDSPTNMNTKLAQLRSRLVELQVRYDVEHLTVINLLTQLASKPSLATPNLSQLTKQVTDLKKTVAEQQRIISAYSAQINNLRDALASSQKKM